MNSIPFYPVSRVLFATYVNNGVRFECADVREQCSKRSLHFGHISKYHVVYFAYTKSRRTIEWEHIKCVYVCVRTVHITCALECVPLLLWIVNIFAMQYNLTRCIALRFRCLLVFFLFLLTLLTIIYDYLSIYL